jgi:hypothetical protein
LEGRIPVVVSQNKNNPELLVHTPFGPMLDSNSFPCRPGQIFLSSTTYEKFGLKKGKGFNDAWNSDVWQAGACRFRLPEKNGLPVDVPIEDGMSPLGEVMRIMHGLLLLGFHFYGSGGVLVVNGFVSPSANSKAATDSSGGRDGATFETAQTVENKVNFTMDQLCERGSIIAMFVAGKALPAEFHDKSLPPAMHLGTYCVRQCAQEDPMEPDDIKQMLAFYKDHYALDSCMLRFHLAYKKKYLAVPVVCDGRAYRHIEVDKRDDRKPLFAVPEEASYRSLLSSDAPIFISEKQMISDWIQDGGHLELVDDPYQEPGK